MNLQIAALIITIVLAFVGYFVTHRNNLLLHKRKDRLELTNKRINDFYGPLYVLSNVGETALKALLIKIKRESDPQLEKPLTDQEFAEWRIWMVNVFMPLNELSEKIVLENAYLIREKQMPQCILDFVTHISAWKAVLVKWENGDFSEQFSIIDYPEALKGYATISYDELKNEQLMLIGQLK